MSETSEMAKKKVAARPWTTLSVRFETREKVRKAADEYAEQLGLRRVDISDIVDLAIDMFIEEMRREGEEGEG